jgi:hemoglobin
MRRACGEICNNFELTHALDPEEGKSMTKSASHRSLYERIGGATAIHAAVDVFYQRILADPSLAGFFVGLSVQRLKTHQFAFLSQTLGVPGEYSEVSMQAAHQQLAIGQRHFDAVATHLIETLKSVSIPDDIIADIGVAIAPLAPCIVNTPSLATPV